MSTYCEYYFRRFYINFLNLLVLDFSVADLNPDPLVRGMDPDPVPDPDPDSSITKQK
jgi:hypothetical protein